MFEDDSSDVDSECDDTNVLCGDGNTYKPVVEAVMVNDLPIPQSKKYNSSRRKSKKAPEDTNKRGIKPLFCFELCLHRIYGFIKL